MSEGWCSGTVTCENCGSESVSVWPATVERQECPFCHHMTQSPPSEETMTPEESHWEIIGGDERTAQIYWPGGRSPNLPLEQAERIVACVNACKGIPTDELKEIPLAWDFYCGRTQ